LADLGQTSIGGFEEESAAKEKKTHRVLCRRATIADIKRRGSAARRLFPIDQGSGSDGGTYCAQGGADKTCEPELKEQLPIEESKRLWLRNLQVKQKEDLQSY
jgi:hypothetical protein